MQKINLENAVLHFYIALKSFKANFQDLGFLYIPLTVVAEPC